MHNILLHSLAVAMGGAVGATLRYWISLSIAGWSLHWPLATFSVNILGSLLMGMGAGYFNGMSNLEVVGSSHSWIKYFLLTGCLGGLTTFSTFSIEALGLLQQSRYMIALSYMLASFVLSVSAAGVGWYAAQRFFHF